MRKIIPLIILMVFAALLTKAQNIDQQEKKIALQSVAENKALIGISSDELSNALVSSTFEDQVSGIRYVYLQQAYKGIPVYNQMKVLSFRNGKLLTTAGAFDPGIAKLVNVSSGMPSVTAESAVQSAISDRGLRANQMAIAINRKDNGRLIEFSDMGISQENITAQLIWVPNPETKVYELAWQVYLIPKTTPDYWLILVNAVDNRIMGMDNLTEYDNWGVPDENTSIRYPAFVYNNFKAGELNKDLFDFKKNTDKSQVLNSGPTLADNADYRVIPIPFEAPSFMPGPSTTWHALRSNPWTNSTVANATTLKWHTGLAATDYNYTRGNNVWAYHDRNNQNTGDPARSATSSTALPNLTFDFTPDYTLEPVVTSPPNQQFNITNLFYWNNLIHDIFYAYGFTEAGGNFQDDNMSRGGVGNDHVNAEAQDGSGSNNANFSTPADGGSGRMQMYLWTAPTPDRDGDVDNGIIIHEFGHGIAKRITGGPGNTNCLTSTEQGGEGISDYFGLMLTQDWSTATLNTGFNSPRGIGTYALNQPPTGAGIRPTRYCTDFTINPTTYANIATLAVPHGVGYAWCTMLWEMTWELINEIGTITPNIYDWNGTGGNVRALRMVMEGLRTQPCQPGFVDARNHILKADTTLYGGIYYCAITRAFARRGVGVNALQGSNSRGDETPDFTGGGPAMNFTQNGASGIPEGQNIVYNHAITAACSALSNYTLRDTLPLNVTFVSATNGGTYNAGNRVVSWPVNIAVNATANYGLTVNINAGSYFPPAVLINETVPSTTISGFWTTASTTANVWIAHNVRSNSAPNSFFTPDAGTTSDQTIATTASFAIGATPPTLSFWHWYNSENNWDGAVLEISLNGGTSWIDIGASNFTQNGYNGTLNSSANPLAGRAAWMGNSNGFIQTKVNMMPYANQSDVKLRWRFGSDASVAATGWNVDDISLQTIAVVNLRSNLFNASNVRVDIKDTVTVILPPSAVPPTVTIDQAVTQADPTSASPIDFTVVFDQPVIGFATGDVTLSGTAGATTGTVTGSGSTYNVAVSGMTSSGTVIATIAAGVCTNTALDPNVASTSTDNTVTYNLPPPPPGCINAVSYTGPPVPIPDADPLGVNIPLTVSGIGTIADLNFRLDPGAGTCDNTAGNVNASIDHTFLADLIITLTSPAATTVTLINRRGSFGNNFCLVTLDDDGSFPSISTIGSGGGITGDYAPENPLSAFDGQNADGIWTLNVSDNAGLDVGNVRGFSLIFTGIPPTMNPVPNDTVCNNTNAGPYNFSSSTPGVTYGWTNSNPTIGLAASGTGNIPAFTATNASNAPVNATITVTPNVGLCFGAPITFIIRVNPDGQVNPVPNQTVCKGLPTNAVNFTTTVPGTVFSWTNNNTSIGLAATGNGNIPSFIAQNNTGVPQVATITVTPGYGSGGVQQTQTFSYTGAVQTWVVPAGVTSIDVKTWGAQGNANALSVSGGLGGYAEGTLAVTPGQTLYINAGGGGSASINGNFNGGGPAGTSGCATAQGGGGGGASDVRVAANTLGARAIVAAGGGGAGGNRVSGCGRGTGGGGGGGYYGGGGAAAWPFASTTLPTGGTQSAGGIGGTSTYTGAPGNNGTAGALGVGGTGGNEVSSSQGGSATALAGGVGGGLVGANGAYSANWTGQSGAGGSSYIGGVSAGVTNSGVNAGNGRVEFNYAAGGLSCSGTPISFTITVNPNQDLVIVADPGTTICEGDPTLLTVRVGSSSPVGTLYNQSGAQVNGSPSQVFEPANAAFDSQSADDFTVPSGTTWTISQITANGIGTGNPTSVNVFFYANSGSNLPGAAVASFTNISTFTRTGGNYSVTLPSAVNLAAGTYWLSFQVNMSFAAGGQWFWANFGTTNIGNQYAWQNPGGGFGTPCTAWGYGATGCNVGGGVARNNIFSLVGSSITDGGPLPGGYTFLWSPAAGLSSTTSNPVAASPMNTTLYTVNTTTGAGCLNSASILITVNKRPTVTTHPTSRANCVGTSATFTVVGTGTALTYQWQLSTAGAGGPWTNITNGGVYSGATTATLTVNPVTQTMTGYAYRCVLSGSCAAIGTNNISNAAILTVNPNPVVNITPPVSCGGVAGISGTQLSVGSAPPPVPGAVTVNSGTINLTVPDNTANGVSNVLNVAGVPANATITNVSVTLNMSHTYPGDMIFNLRAPNGQILNLYKYGSGQFTGPVSGVPTWGWYGATVSQAGNVAWSTVNVAPFIYNNSTAWRADAINTPVPGPTVQNPTGFVSNAANFAALYTTGPSTNGAWTLAMADGGPGDIGVLASWTIKIDYTTPGGGGGPVLSYVWSPLAGLYTNATATIPYTGTNTPVVYAAPTVFTVYTVTATDVATGCFSTATAQVNYTPPAPTVTPSAVTMCLGDPAVRLTSSSSTTTTVNFASGPISVIIPDNNPAGATSNINVTGIPAGATIASARVNFNMNHTWAGDVAIALKAPNNNILNLDYYLSGTGGTGATTGFTNTTISSTGTAALSSAGSPYTGTFRADAAGAASVPPAGPTGYLPTGTTWGQLYSVPNGTWTLAMVDGFGGDQGTLTSWSLSLTYILGVPSTAATWSPVAGLFNDAAATIPYAGTPRDTVWTRPTPSGVYPYQVTVQSVPTVLPIGTPTTTLLPNNGQALVTFNVTNNNTFAVTLTDIAAAHITAGSPTVSAYFKPSAINGPPGPISAANGWTQFGTGTATVPTANVITPSLSGLSLVIPAGATYGLVFQSLLGTAANARYQTLTAGTYTFSDGGVDIVTGTNIGYGGVAAPGAPTFTPRGFVGSVTVSTPVAPCTSPARTVIVTVNQPTTLNPNLPVPQTVCTDKVATFTTAVAAGTGPHSYQWQVSTNGGNPPWNNVANGGVYSGATSATLSITAPPVSMSGYFYRCVVSGAAPCAAVTSIFAQLTVNPLPTIVIAANPYTSLFPGLTTTLSSTVSPNAAASYTWIRNGSAVPGATSGTLNVDVDGMGNYQLRVTDVNGCANISNTVTIKDSATAKCFIYPNPTSGQFQVRYYSVANNVLPRSLTVYDAKGDRVFTQFYTVGRPYDRMDVDMRAYGKGLYWVEIGDLNGNRITMCRVVIQ